jgi:aryl-alcohol dehydrogenase-like predicted oxidoreductase
VVIESRVVKGRGVKIVRLGSQGLTVSELGVGCMNLSMGYAAPPSEGEALRLLSRAVELGVSFFDTAEMYGPFHNEILVGKGLQSVRHRVVIATKFGFDIRGNETRPLGVNSRPEHIRVACEASLKRLGIERIDLLYQHRVDPTVPIEDVAGTVGELVQQGKVRFFGLSEAAPNTVRRAHSIHPVTALQTEYSLWSRGGERDVLATCRELGIGFVAYSPLGRGFLAGAAREMAANDFRRSSPRWQGTALVKNLRLVDALSQIAQEKKCTLAQLALAWLLHQGPDIVPLPGTSKVSRLEENVAAADIRLSADDLTRIERAIPAEAVEGDRYDAAGAALIDRS